MSDLDLDCGDCNCDCDCDCGDCVCDGSCCAASDSDSGSYLGCFFCFNNSGRRYNQSQNQSYHNESCWCCWCCDDDYDEKQSKPATQMKQESEKQKQEQLKERENRRKESKPDEQYEEEYEVDKRKEWEHAANCPCLDSNIPKNRCPYKCSSFGLDPPSIQRFETLDREKYVTRNGH